MTYFSIVGRRFIQEAVKKLENIFRMNYPHGIKIKAKKITTIYTMSDVEYIALLTGKSLSDYRVFFFVDAITSFEYNPCNELFYDLLNIKQ